MSKKTCLVLIVQFLWLSALAQEFNGKNLKWRLPENTDTRFKAFFGSNGTSFGSEGSSLVVENLTANKLVLKCKVTIYDFCGNSQVKELSRTANPMSVAGASAWFDGFSYTTSCTERKKYSEKFYSKIRSVTIEVLSVQEIPAGATANKNSPPNINRSETKGAAACNAGLPRILISEAGEYYAKAADGSYQKITREMYAVYKSKTTEEEKERHILDCTGGKNIQIKVPNMNQ